MDWADHAQDWPMAETSRFVLCKPHRWHVQERGEGPLILLLHGAGGSTQSWRHVMPKLSTRARVVALDLPGQGFTKSGAAQRHGLVSMAQDIASLCTQQGWSPNAIIGHSAGAAIALQLTMDNAKPAPVVVGINAALSNFKGLAGIAFPIIAKTLSMVPGVAHLFTASTSRKGSVTRLIVGTGSTLSDDELRWYRALISNRDHVDATLSMMAQWDLNPLLARLGSHPSNVLLIAAEGDKAVPPATSKSAAVRLRNGTFVSVPNLGHLAHEEDADAVLTPLLAFLESHDVLAPQP